METYSTTQTTNIAAFAAAISLIVSHPNLSNPADVQTLITALVIAVTAIISWINRFKKGDVTVTGRRL
ncbi:MAG: hypothetical protein V4438_04295 [Patescibacteria group bacterium]